MAEVKTGEKTYEKSQEVGKTPIPDVGTNPERVKKEVKEKNFTFRENRKYDLTLGRTVIIFTARETKSLPESLLQHPDWPQAAKLFVVKDLEPVKSKVPAEREGVNVK